MIWNQQLLSFAAYKQEDGSILGDPVNLQLTKDIIELGWTPPTLRTRWDLLPIVAMAEGDEPCMVEVTEKDFPLVRIFHPAYELQSEKLGLRWVPAPALSRHGFDIGGVQYTAAPFIGWFMDAEIGVRDLADSFRYNVLPQVAFALGWIESEQELDRLPEYERLAIISRAQTELNYAVCHSYKASGVTMSDTLSASSMYCNFDDDHFQSKGYRLPSNPYWLALPQGSIVPIWHRGGAPNYQPSPMICRHVQDPVKAWRREQQKRFSEIGINSRLDVGFPFPATCPRSPLGGNSAGDTIEPPNDDKKPNIYICFCSAASTAKKLAYDLHRRLSKTATSRYTIASVTTLNDFNPRKSSNSILLVIASTAGHGEMPLNGQRLLKTTIATPMSFFIFGNGSSQYGDRYNAAAKMIQSHLLNQKATLIRDGLYAGDTAKEEPPWSKFDEWCGHIEEALNLDSSQSRQPVPRESTSRIENSTEIASTYSTAKLVSCVRTHPKGIQRVILDIGEQQYDALSHVSMIVPNDSAVVKYALRMIGLSGKENVFPDSSHQVTVGEYLEAFVDFDQPFMSLDWARNWGFSRPQTNLIGRLPIREALRAFKWPWRKRTDLHGLFAAMPLKTPRTFSVASSAGLLASQGKNGILELLVQHREGGLVSSFLQKARPGVCIRMKVKSLDNESLLSRTDVPVICFATGSGLAPVLSLLQHRLAMRAKLRPEDDRERALDDNSHQNDREQGAMTLILGHRKSDAQMIGSVLRESIDNGIIDMLLTTPSNDHKSRAQDRVFDDIVRRRIEHELKYENAAVFVCALPEATADFARNLSALVGCDIQSALGDRYIEEVYKPAC